MELLSSADLLGKDRILTPFRRWTDDLHSMCGNFNPSSMDASLDIRGEARRINAGGMEFSQVSNDLDRIDRDWDDIRRDANEQLFLIVQIEGCCGVEHSEKHSVLNVGDCILVDSTRPTTFYFGGAYSNHLSMSLPYQLTHSHGSGKFDVGRKLEAYDPMAIMLRALLAKILSTPESDAQAGNLRDLMYHATRQAFVSEAQAMPPLASLSDSASRRLQVVEVLIDQHLTNTRLSAKWLATKVGVSTRTLQQHFQGLGMTCTTVIRDKRLRFAREKIEQIRIQRGTQTIADIAYSSGFNDVSYFNRSFRELFDCAPTDLLKRRDGH